MATVSKALTERIAALAVQLNDKAVKAAERKVHEVVRSAGEQRSQAERELADASETVDDLETKLDEAQTNAKGLASVQVLHQAQAVELAKVKERLELNAQMAKAANEQHATDLERAGKAETDVHAECSRLRMEITNENTEFGALQNEFATVKAKATATDKAHQEQTKKAAADALHQAERLTKAEADRDAAREHACEAREEVAKLTGKLEAVTSQNMELLAVIKEPILKVGK